MTKKQISKNKNKSISSSDRLEVILEDVRDQIVMVAEGVSVVNDKIDRVSNELNEFKEETASNFRLVFSHFSVLEDELVDIRKELEKLKKRDSEKITRKEFVVFEKRISKLEIKLEKVVLANKIKQKV